MSRDNVISFDQGADGARRRVSDARTGEIVAACRASLVDTLPRLMQDLFEHLDDELYQLADKSHNDVVQTSYFETMRELRKLREPIEEAYLRTQLAAYDDFWKRGRAAVRRADEAKLDEKLELVGNDELEENLAIGSMISKAENRFHRELFAMNMRFAQLLGVPEITDSDNPVAPASLAGGFKRALELWRGELAMRLVIFKLFDRYAMSYIGGIFDDINDHLVAANILPKIVQRVRRNPVAPSVERARNPDHPEHDSGRAEGERGYAGGRREGDAQQAEILSVLSELLAVNRQRGHGGLGFGGNPGTGYANVKLPEISSGDLIQALNAIQHQTLDAGS